jgi:hypothetical protein
MLVFEVPTYVGNETIDFDYERKATLFLYEDDGLRICMGGEREEPNRPDVVIEKTEQGYRVFVHPANCDPVCIVEIATHGNVTTSTVTDDRGVILLQEDVPLN